MPPNQSVGADGSGMELRNVYWNGQLVMRRAHAPMLFAEYKGGQGGDCYRDWKNTPTGTLAASGVQNQLGNIPDGGNPAITSCDRSTDATASYGACPFQLPIPAGYTCANGVAIENMGDHVRLTAQYSADWYRYASRMEFYVDGRIVPTFGFGNGTGTFNSVTHWHHNYWRFEFDIDGLGNNTVSIDNQDQATEFSDLRSIGGGIGGGPRTWSVRNGTSGNGYRFVPGATDYGAVTNESGRNFHTVDFMATKVHANEYADSPNNNLFDCTMDKNVLVNGESIANTNQALYYHVSVRDATANSWPNGCGGGGVSCLPQDSMVCKKAGPTLYPFGPWADLIFANGFDVLVPGARLDFF
ncbi:MAG TPA: hypothetical protein PK001_06290 [Dokdonella sp.]|uniref:hypothetical protein n=2 Tax=Dokdonella sp. TaxID=2291710 RepID=UPI002D03D01F|nr:hypothetical protein [Dokdonella sp.]HOX71335.1 hypothetical protein [Dokdonella sp.]